MKKKKDDDQPVRTSFQSCAAIYAEADLDQSQGSIVLWLGASTAVELTYDEAEKILSQNLTKNKRLLQQTIEDLELMATMTGSMFLVKEKGNMF